MKLFSVVVPVYNVAPYLRECLDSLLAQTVNLSGSASFAPDCWEAICVDDGSTDGSGAILDEYVARDQRFRVLHKANGGVGPARNDALALAKGEWICFVDADDLLVPSAFARLRELWASCPDADVLRFRALQFVDGARPAFGTAASGAVVEEDVSRSLTYAQAGAQIWEAAYRRRILPVSGFRRYSMCEDRLFLNQCLLNANVYLTSPDVLYGYRVRPGSAVTSRVSMRKALDSLGAYSEWLKLLCEADKSVESGVFREIVLALTERTVYDLCYLNDLERHEAWKRWYDVMEEVVCLDNVGWFRLMIVKLNLRLRQRWLAKFCFALPHYLKLKGFHR